jgi:uncharacterized protein (DUF1778 family)
MPLKTAIFNLYGKNPYAIIGDIQLAKESSIMPIATDIESTRNERIELRATSYEKTLLTRAATMEHLDLTSFVMRTTVPTAQEIVERTERVVLSERDTLRVLELLENPPKPNKKLIAAAQAWANNQNGLSNQ